jgi:hypothetical protein
VESWIVKRCNTYPRWHHVCGLLFALLQSDIFGHLPCVSRDLSHSRGTSLVRVVRCACSQSAQNQVVLEEQRVSRPHQQSHDARTPSAVQHLLVQRIASSNRSKSGLLNAVNDFHQCNYLVDDTVHLFRFRCFYHTFLHPQQDCTS